MHRNEHSVKKMCKALGIPQCSFYQWSRQEAKRDQRRLRETELVQTVRSVFEEYLCVYGCTNLGWVYLAAVLDLCNKEVIGYSISKNIDTELVKNALGNAVASRGRHKGLVFHSDRGCQYSSRGYRTMLNELEITPSMSAPGCPYDNAAMESFFASLKKEQVHHRVYADIDEVREDLFKYIE